MARWMIATGALALAACAQPQAQTAGLPVTTAQATAGAPAASGEARIPVRVLVGEGAAARPATADCVAQGAGFRSAFVAPAVVAVPTYGAASGDVRIDCAADGLRGARLARPSQTRPAVGGGVVPAIGVGVSSGGGTSVSLGGWWGGGGGWAGPQREVIRYPAVEVTLR